MPRKMKESGVEWLGQIPEGWGVCRCKFILCRNDGGIWGNDPVGEDGEFVLRSTEQTIDGNWEVIAPAKRDLSVIPNKEYFLIRAGDLLVTKSSGSDLHIGKTTLADEAIEKGHYYYSNFLQRLRFDGSTAPRFVWYLMNSCIARQQFVYRQNSTSGIGNINAADIDELKFPRPPLPEQQRIAAFLDERCAKIDGMIAEAKISIEDYKKWKQSLIEKVTLKGVELAPLAAVNSDWVEQVPAHWRFTQIRYLFELRDERNEKPLSEVNLISLYTDKGVVQHCDLEKTTGNKAATADGYKLVYEDDIVVNIILCWMGAIGRSAYAGVTSPAYDVYRAKRKGEVLPRYYHYLFRTTAFSGACYRRGRGIMMMRWRTYSDEFRSIKVPVPSYAEQEQIANYLDEKCAAIDKLVGEKEALIADLEAYKKSLIFETITGKREVA